MNESVSPLMDQSKSNLTEINNNLAWKKKRNGSQVSVSSASSYQSDSSDDNLSTLERKASLQDIIEITEDKQLFSDYNKKCRSMSDGAAGTTNNDDSFFEVFPSLPNSVLEKMGLYGNGTGERLNDEELEQKFTSLALAFTIDAATIKDRCERQRRHRDQTEENLSVEIEKFREKLALMQPLCTDFEKAELLSTLMTQIDIIMSATSMVSIAAERYGSVQHEERLAESVHLMVNHVQLLKQQRDAARRQFQYTKRFLQNSPDSPTGSPTNPPKFSLITTPCNNRMLLTQRRASVATFSERISENKPLIEVKKVIARRTSENSLRASSLIRNGRPTRLELGGELLKITEGFVETPAGYQHENNCESDNEESITEPSSNTSSPQVVQHVDLRKLPPRDKIIYRIKKIGRMIEDQYKKWTEDGTIHEVFCFCALICFSLSLLTMVNILIEYEYAKRGLGSSHLFWSWSSGYNS